jgi:hypothetical protein
MADVDLEGKVSGFKHDGLFQRPTRLAGGLGLKEMLPLSSQ